MGLRSELLTELVKEVLGPRKGPYEILDASPLDEYLTGVLQPAGLSSATLDVEGMIDHISEGVANGEEDLEDSEILPAVFSPALDPRARPSSIGLSFRVRAVGTSPRFRICVSWARYQVISEENLTKEDELDRVDTAVVQGNNKRGLSGQSRWQRHPRVCVLDLSESATVYLGEGGRVAPDRAEISLHFRLDSERGEPGTFGVLIQLVNRIRPADPDRLRAEECIFQPAIRVLCGEGTRLEPVRSTSQRDSVEDDEEAQLDFLYRNLPVMARGHLVSAIWRDIDPERPAPDGVNQLDEPPFTWVDGVLLDEETRRAFSPPDVRTEFVPVYASRSPEFNWESTSVPENVPQLDASRLAEIAADAHALQAALMPLVEEYRRWIDLQEKEIGALSGTDRKIAARLLRTCRTVLRRLQTGLDLLATDSDVRLSFAFANRAMALQASWSGRKLQWRPFQLAFVLMNLEPIANQASPDRDVCDLLWVPTGGGKTEAYLALAAFTLAFRRRRALQRTSGESDRSGAGVAVLSRYTLRLLTIQQFRRALAMITACEVLRVYGLKDGQPVGWRPPRWPDQSDFLWGSVPFRIGLWVGGGLTPNRLKDGYIRQGRGRVKPGALSILQGNGRKGGQPAREEGEPAQILECPACQTILSIPDEGIGPGEYNLHLVVRKPERKDPSAYVRRIIVTAASGPGFDVSLRGIQELPSETHLVVSLELDLHQDLRVEALDKWWNQGPGTKLELACFRVSRPGYFPVAVASVRKNGGQSVIDFEIWCPNPECPLAMEWWCEGVPADISGVRPATRGGSSSYLGGRFAVKHPRAGRQITLRDEMVFRTLPEVWRADRSGDAASLIASRIPIPALTVDEQIYRRLPSMIVATVDKFARLPFEPAASSLFGNVSYYKPGDGYYREKTVRNMRQVCPPDPPDLILQDELHLLEGPLGSLAGVYETVVDFLCSHNDVRVKYVAATATIRHAGAQIRSLFDREVLIFPPPGLHVWDRFFLRGTREPHPLEEEQPGQLYVGICAPGRGPLTPVARIWACLLQQVFERKELPEADFFWTLVGYFNAIRELAGALALYRQDIPQRIRDACPESTPRPLVDDPVQLSSLIPSTSLPALLEQLDKPIPTAPDALLATAMFGTGVDIPRLSLMVVHGQPKTTSAYIQATGRVGRRRGALVVTFLRASRPRDLSHYEFFCGYHRQLHRHVEPVTVMPFSPGALDLASGPVAVALLRHRRDASHPWYRKESASDMKHHRDSPEVMEIPTILELRSQRQPEGRRPDPREVRNLTASGLDRWREIAAQHELEYVEYVRPPQKAVVLGDPEHGRAGLPVVFENVPQSMREVEETLDLEV